MSAGIQACWPQSCCVAIYGRDLILDQCSTLQVLKELVEGSRGRKEAASVEHDDADGGAAARG